MKLPRKKRDPDRLVRRVEGALTANTNGDRTDRETLRIIAKIIREERFELAQT